MVVSEEEFWLAMHITDSAFPGGALANSQGLESAVYHGLVCKNDRDSLKSFINLTLEQAKSLMLPFVRTSHQLHKHPAKEEKGRSNFGALDNLYHCMQSNEISRRSSTNQGKCFRRVMTETFPSQLANLLFTNSSSGHNELSSVIGPSVSTPLHYHFPPSFGLICGELGISLTTTDRMFMRMIMRDLISAAARLNIIGPIEGSQIQAQYFAVIEELIGDTSNDWDSKIPFPPSPDGEPLFYNGVKPIQSAPILDLVQSRHDILYTRMFNS